MSTSAVTERLRYDLQEYARLSDAWYEPARVDPVLEVLTEIAPDALMAVRTTTEPVGERDVNVRFMHFPADPVAALRAAGLLRFTGHPLEQVLAAVSEAVPVQFGVDVAIASGAEGSRDWNHLSIARGSLNSSALISPDETSTASPSFFPSSMNSFSSVAKPNSWQSGITSCKFSGRR